MAKAKSVEPPARPGWEYLKVFSTPLSFDKLIRPLGEDGWELVAAVRGTHKLRKDEPPGVGMWLLLKRPVASVASAAA